MNPDTVHKQLERLMRGGLTIDEACSALRHLGFSEREVRPLHTGVFRVTEVQLFHGGRVSNSSPGSPYRGPGRPLSSLPRDPDPLFRGWEKPPSRRWDKVISRGSWLAIEAGAFTLMILGTAHAAASFQSPLSIWIASSGALVTTVALIRMRRGRQ